MAKRRITDRQRRHIARIQEKRQARAQARLAGAADQLEQEGLGPEQAGLLIANHGRSAVVEPQDRPGNLVRCTARQNLPTVVAGDRVIWQPSQTETDRGVISAVQQRQTELSREDRSGKLKPIAANVSLMMVVIAPRPSFDEYLLDRYLVAAHHSRLRVLVVLNKADLLAEAEHHTLRERLAVYQRLGYDWIAISTRNQTDVARLSEIIAGHTAVLVGQSGVGKSSIINALIPEVEARTSAVSAVTGLGVHTTTTTTLYHLDANGDGDGDAKAKAETETATENVVPGSNIIDSPGVRAFSLWKMDAREIQAGFIDIAPLAERCQFSDCTHQHEPNCAVRQALNDKTVDPARLERMFRVIDSLN